MYSTWLILFIITCTLTRVLSRKHDFPPNFLFGIATSSYQIEGAWNEGGRGEGIWDHMIHENPGYIPYKANADVAIDSYHMYEKDIKSIKDLNVDIYRFSVSWPRILPTGKIDNINAEGLNYYDKLINSLIKNNIIPMITLYHWDLPQALENEGGFLNDSFPTLFEDFARVVFDNYADRVKHWITFNEPSSICLDGYGLDFRAPRRNFHGYGEYICVANLLKAHAKAYKLYHNYYKPKFGGKVGYALAVPWCLNMTDSEEDQQATKECFSFQARFYADPIFSKDGGYPQVVIDKVSPDRLVKIPVEEIKGTADFIGVNHYDVFYVKRGISMSNTLIPSFKNDLNATLYFMKKFTKRWLEVGPSSLGKILDWIKVNYDDPEIFITENGMTVNPGLDDRNKVWYTRRYLAEVSSALQRGIKIKGYFHWTLADNFEWQFGYTERYGMYQVDFDDKERTRTPRRSAKMYAHIVKTRTIDPDYMNDVEWEKGPELPLLFTKLFVPKFDSSPTYERAVKINEAKNATRIQNVITALNLQVLTFNSKIVETNIYPNKRSQF